jgi:putative two-component system response regulator
VTGVCGIYFHIRRVPDAGCHDRDFFDNFLAEGNCMTSPRVNSEDRDAAILVVDDHEFNLELMEGLLYREGYKVLTAPDAETALNLFRKEPLDLAILDVMMPGMNGLDLCRQLKSMADKRFFPVMLVTALSEIEDKIAGLEAGADDFLTKPVHTIELLTKIRSLLRLRKLQSQLDHSEDVILTLAIAIEAKDPYTKGHSERVGGLSTVLAGFLGMSGQDCDSLFKAGILHDVGKLGIEDRVLHKTEHLDEHEAKLIKDHVLIGETICNPLHSARRIIPVIRNHHERWDGEGFPDRLKGEDIPLFARIVAITDSFDAMVSLRPYRSPLSVMDALERMEEEKYFGQWDPNLLESFIEMMRGQGGSVI